MRDTAVTSRGSETNSRSSVVPSFDSYFQEAIGAPLVISGIAQSDSAVHSPNERLVVANYYRGIDAVIRFICGMAR
jgi:acetylornithine deacetylase/succinyl-diaminopimelate desuccinylase-like protein